MTGSVYNPALAMRNPEPGFTQRSAWCPPGVSVALVMAMGLGGCSRKPAPPVRPADQAHPAQRDPGKDESKEEPKDPTSDQLCGYLDASGRMAIPARFTAAGEFSSGLAAVVIHDKTGFIDSKGDLVIAPSFDAAEAFREGVAPACVKGKGWGFIDGHGAWVIPPHFRFADAFSEGAAVVAEADDPGAVCFGQVGRRVVAGSACENLEISQDDDDRPGGYFLVDHAGKRLTAKGYHCITRVSDGMAAALWKDRWGYLDRTGKEVIRPRFARAKPFGEGWAAVQMPDRDDGSYGDGKWGFIDRQGRFRLYGKFAATEVGTFAQGLIAMEGLPLKSLFASPVGRACVLARGQTAQDLAENPDSEAACGAYLDKKGQIQVAVPYCFFDDVGAGERSLREFRGGYAEVAMQEPRSVHPFACTQALTVDVRMFIDRKGAFVMPAQAVSALAPEGLLPACHRGRPRWDPDLFTLR